MTELDLEKVEPFIQNPERKKKKIFVVGQGRSGFVGRAFALRLMNMGLTVYFLGETITPAAEKDDLIIAISGSGTTKITLTASATAKEIGAQVAVVTSYPESPLGRRMFLRQYLQGLQVQLSLNLCLLMLVHPQRYWVQMGLSLQVSILDRSEKIPLMVQVRPGKVPQ